MGLEYLTYQVLEIISDVHFKTRPVEMNYIDTDKKKKPWKHTTFLIENVEDAAIRSGLRFYQLNKNSLANTNLNQLA